MRSFDVEKTCRYIALGKPVAEILPLFEPLIRVIIKQKVSFDPRNHHEDDLLQIGLLKAQEVINKFDPAQGNLFHYASKLICQALWAVVRLKHVDKMRVSEDFDLDTTTDFPGCAHTKALAEKEQDEYSLPDAVKRMMRVEDPEHMEAADYIYGVLIDNDAEQNRSKILKTLSQGYNVNAKASRYLLDHVMVCLRKHFTTHMREVRDDALFDNKYKFSLIPELRELLGERSFERLVHYFGGVTISVPSRSTLLSLDRDIEIIAALAADWTSGPRLARQFGISPEGIKASYKSSLHRIHTDPEYRAIVEKRVDLSKLPGYDDPSKPVKKIPERTYKVRKLLGRRKALITKQDSMGFAIGSRNSLIFTMMVAGNCTREQIIHTIVDKFKGNVATARATVGAFLSDVRQPHGKYNTARGLDWYVGVDKCLKFTPQSLEDARQLIQARQQADMLEEIVETR